MGPSYAVSCMMEKNIFGGRPRFLETAFSGAFSHCRQRLGE